MTLEANKVLVRRYFEELANEGALEVAAEILTPEAVTIMQEFTVMLRTAFPDFHITIHHQVAEGDLVRSMALSLCVFNFSYSIVTALYVVYVVRELGISPAIRQLTAGSV